MAEVKVMELTKKFGDLTVLKDITLRIKSGEFLTLLGPSGCGKSTLLRIIAGLEHATQGSVYIAGRRVNDVRPKDRNIAMVFQSYALYPHLNVFDNIAMPLRMRMLSTFERTPFLGRILPRRRQREKEIKSSVSEVAGLLDISHLLERKPSEISGGQRQRVALGRAMVRNPSVFLMDEPLSNLDARLRVHMRTEIVDLHRKLDATFIYVTHDQAEAMTMSDQIALMIDGVILQVDPPTEMYSNPKYLKVAEFIGNPKINLIPGTVSENGRITCCGRRLPVVLDHGESRNIQIGIRSEALQVVDGLKPGWTGRVTHLEHLGAYFLIHVRLDGIKKTIISRVSATRMAVPELGTKLRLSASPDNFLFFGSDGARLHRQIEIVKEVRYA